MSISKRARLIIPCFILLTIVPVLLGCFYTGPSVDDYEMIRFFKEDTGIRFLYPFQTMIKYYIYWQGSYFAIFMASLPVFNIFGILGYRIWLCVIAIIFFVVLFLCINKLLSLFNADPTVKYLTFFFVLLYLLGFNSLDDTFFWFNSSGVYTDPMICSFLSIYCLIQYLNTSKKKFAIIGSILAFLGAGGSLCIPAFLCATLLILTLCVSQKGKPSLARFAIFGSAFVGALINVLAPGNFLRKDEISSGTTVPIAMINTIYRVNRILSESDRIGFLLVVVCLVFFIAYEHKEINPDKYKHPVLVTIYCYLGVIATDLPVIYGYGFGEDMTTRCMFIEAESIIFLISICAAYWGKWAAANKVFSFSKEHKFIIFLICCLTLSPYINIHNVEELTPYKMVLHMVGSDNDFALHVQRQEGIIHEIVSSDSDDVVIHIPAKGPEEWTNTRSLGLKNDPTYWVNVNIARYFDKNTVTLIVDD